MTLGIGDLLIIFFTLSIFSLLYKENPFSVFSEHIFVTEGQAFALIVAIDYITKFAIVPMYKGSYWGIIPVVLGLMTYFRYTKGYKWISRIPISISIGVGLAVSLRAIVATNFLAQISATIVPLFVAGNLLATFGNIVVVTSVMTTVIYFYFSKPHKGVLRASSRFGYYLFYIAFGTYFASVFMGRVGLFMGRMRDLLLYDRMIATLILTAIILIATFALDKKGLLRKSIGYKE